MQARKAFAEGLRRLRARTKLSQAALAEQSGLSLQSIAAMEQQRKEPSMATLDALSKALGVSVAELFVPDDRSPRAGFAADIGELLAELSPLQRERVLVIVREACALGTAKRAR